MSRFQLLCVTMHQTDFSKIADMNIHSDIVYANQTDNTSYAEYCFDGHTAKMISTNTKGVGINRNLSLMLADADICLLADDDMVYKSDVEKIVLDEFNQNPKADIIIFNVHTAGETKRKQKNYARTRKCFRFERMPWGGVRIAFRLSAIRKANIWFTTLFGGGALYSSGEDSIWLKEAKRKGLCFYVSKEFIGTVSFDSSTWYTGRDEKLFFARGAYIAQMHSNTFQIWKLYYALRFFSNTNVRLIDRLKWIDNGRAAFNNMMSYDQFINERSEILDEKV
jgi:glycosyltransferase involved in cell wall biosynthesis